MSLTVVAIAVNPVYAILGLPDNFNNNNNTSAQEQSQTQPINGFSLYQNDMFGFTIQYPSDWRIDERNNQYYLDTSNQNPVLNANDIVNFLSSNRTQDAFGSAESGVEISYLPLAKYLDTNDLSKEQDGT
jgi:hypothetical protein